MDDKKQQQRAILEELESIKVMLLDDTISAEFDSDNIPLLDSAIDDDDSDVIPTLEVESTELDSFDSPDIETQTSADSAELQQSLFAATDDTKPETAIQEEAEAVDVEQLNDTQLEALTAPEPSDIDTPEPDSGELLPPPFSTFSDKINRAPLKASGENPFLPKHIRDRLSGGKPVIPKNQTQIHTIAPATKSEADRIVDELIAEYLPEIEAKLRAKLQPLIEQSLQSGSDNHSDEH